MLIFHICDFGHIIDSYHYYFTLQSKFRKFCGWILTLLVYLCNIFTHFVYVINVLLILIHWFYVKFIYWSIYIKIYLSIYLSKYLHIHLFIKLQVSHIFKIIFTFIKFILGNKSCEKSLDGIFFMFIELFRRKNK